MIREIVESGEDCIDFKNGARLWTIYNSQFDDYMQDFGLADKNEVIPSFLQRLQSLDSPIVLDFLSWTDAIRDIALKGLASEGFRGAAVAYSDMRSPATRALDEYLGIRQISGDINTEAPWREVEAFLGGEKANLIMERGYGGLKCLSANPSFYCNAIERLWGMLDPADSMLLLQTLDFEKMEAYRIPIKSWVDRLENMVYCRYTPGYLRIDGYEKYGLILIARDQNSPDSLKM